MSVDLEPIDHLLDQSQMMLTVFRTVIQATDIKPKSLRVTMIDEKGDHYDVTLHELMSGYEKILNGYKETIHGIPQ